MFREIVVGLCLATSAAAQVTNFEAEGNLEASYDVGCLEVQEIDNRFSPADLAGGVLACFKAKQDDAALGMLLTMNLRAAFDMRRVTDKTAHQAGRVLALQISQAAGPKWQPRMEKAFARFGGQGSPQHKAFCDAQLRLGVPEHSPRYMVQHGMKAFTGGGGDQVLENFDGPSAWDDLLKSYLKCSR